MWVHRDSGFGADAVSDPADSDCFNANHSRGVLQAVLGGRDQFRVDGVHETSVDVADGSLEHEQDCDGDE